MRRVFLLVYLGEEGTDADIAPHVHGLREEHGHDALLDVWEFVRKGIDGDDFLPGWIKIGEERLREQRPAPDHRPALNVRIGIVRANHLSGRILRRLDVIERADNLNAGILGRFVFHALHSHLKIGRILVAGENRDLALPLHQRRQLGHCRRAGLVVVHPIEREPLRLWCVAIEHHDRHPAVNRIVDRAGHLARVRRREKDRARAIVHRLANALRLDLAILLRGREPQDFDRDVVGLG